MHFGRAYFEAPEIDSLIYFTSDIDLEVGKYYNVTIKKIKGYDLIGVVSKNSR